jgi:hypothetical protein
MNRAVTSKVEIPKDSWANESKLPRWDWIVLPLLSLMTIGLLAGSAELTARRLFPELGTSPVKYIVNDPSIFTHGIPNAHFWYKTPEGELVEYRFNSSGYRMDQDFAPKAPGTFRIVLLGSSNTVGYMVPREKTYAALLPIELSRRTGQTVEIYNEAFANEFAESISDHFNEVLKLSPDLILWAVDIGAFLPQPRISTAHVQQTTVKSGSSGKNLTYFGSLSSHIPILSLMKLHGQFIAPRMLMHFLYGSRSGHLRAYLAQPDDAVGYLKSEPSALWQTWIHGFEDNYAMIQSQAKTAGVALVVTNLPRQEAALMIAIGDWPKGYDPYKLNSDIRRIVTTQGGTFIDLMPDFRGQLYACQELPYLRVEGHLDWRGHAMVSEFLAKGLTSGVVPALSTPNQLQGDQGYGR